jgi:predicted permease
MRIVKSLRNGLRALLGRRRHERELEAELSLHFEQLVRQYRAEGMGEREAHLAAQREFGNVAGTYEEARRAWRWTWLDDLAKDLRFGARMLRKSPGFTVTAVASLALGIGANTAIFSLVKQVILDTLPVREPERLARISRRNLEDADLPNFSRPFLQDLQNAPGLPFEGFLGAAGMGRPVLFTAEGAEPVTAAGVSGNYYQLLGVRPALGRLFTPTDDGAPGEHPVAVLSYRFWDRRFGRSPAILNQTIRLNDRVFTVVGVAAAGFDGTAPGRSFDVHVPLAMMPYPAAMLANRSDWWIDVYARLKSGVTAEQAGGSLTPLLMRNYEIAGRQPDSEYQQRVRASEHMFATPAMRGSGSPQDWQRALWVLSAMVAAVLLLACVNIAHLLLARASARKREHSVRAAIGAGRWRLIRQHLAESVLLGLMGGALGITVAYGLTETLVGMMVADRAHSTLNAAPNAGMLAFNFAMALAVGVLFGVAPALRASRPDLVEGLKGGRAGGGSGRLITGRILIPVQIASSVVLLMSAALFVRTLYNFRTMDVGFRSDGLVEFGLNPVGHPQDQIHALYDRVRERIVALPGVTAVASGRQLLVGGGLWGSGISIEGLELKEEDRADPLRDAVSPAYFATLGMPLLAGREFTPADNAEAPRVAVINETFARRYFVGRNPVGLHIGEGGHQPEIEVVGVVRDAKYARLRGEETLEFWWAPSRQVDLDRTGTGFIVYTRTNGPPDTLLRNLRTVVAEVDPRIAVVQMRTMQAQIDQNLQVERALALLSLFFGGLAALLAAIGVFGVLSYAVARREREIGIRMALGATPWAAGWEILRGVVLYVSLGLVAGLGGAAIVGKIVEGFLFGVTSRDLISLVSACAAMAVVAAAAAFIPARRAASVPPAVAFRAE